MPNQLGHRGSWCVDGWFLQIDMPFPVFMFSVRNEPKRLVNPVCGLCRGVGYRVFLEMFNLGLGFYVV